MSAPYELGQRVRYAEHIVRRGARDWEPAEPHLLWSGEAYPGKRLDGGEGIIIGKRTLTEGNVIWHGPEDGSEYKATKHFAAYIIAFDLHRKPVHVLPEHITPLSEEAKK